MTAPAGGVATQRGSAPVDHSGRGLPNVNAGERDDEQRPESSAPTSEKKPSATPTGRYGEQHHSPGYLKTSGHSAKAAVRNNVPDDSGRGVEEFATAREVKAISREAWLKDVASGGTTSHVAQVSTPHRQGGTLNSY